MSTPHVRDPGGFPAGGSATRQGSGAAPLGKKPVLRDQKGLCRRPNILALGSIDWPPRNQNEEVAMNEQGVHRSNNKIS